MQAPSTPTRCALMAVALLLLSASVSAAATTSSYTGGEQTYVVPAGVSSLSVTATGAHGGGPTSGFGTGGRGAVVTGTIPVRPGQTLYVEVGGIGGQPDPGWNGGGAGGSRNGLSLWGGGGASDVRTVARGSGGSLASRLIVAGGGGGGAYPGGVGGDAGRDGLSCCSFDAFGTPMLIQAPGGKAGTQTAGGHGGCVDGGFGCGGGCSDPAVSCGGSGGPGVGGDGGSVGDGAPTREGAGGGGGLFGGGGGAAVASAAIGGGGGGSSKVPPDGVQLLGAHTDAASVVISTKPPKYRSLQIPVYLCFDAGQQPPTGTHIIDVSYIDKGNAERHLEMTDVVPTPSGSGGTFVASIGGSTFDPALTLDSNGSFAPFELTGTAVPQVLGGNANVEISAPAFEGFVVAASYCGP